MEHQTVLPFYLDEEVSLDSFYPGGNGAVIQALFGLLDGKRDKSVIYLWGGSGSGKTHLLNGCCNYAREKGFSYAYLPMLSQRQLPELISEKMVLCIDDIQYVVGDISKQKALLSLYERVLMSNGSVVIAAIQPVREIQLELKDLSSRITSGGEFGLSPLQDNEKKQALKERANLRGFELSDSVINFLMTHYHRDTGSLFALLEKIDRVSLSEQKRITIPFVKTLL